MSLANNKTSRRSPGILDKTYRIKKENKLVKLSFLAF